MRIPLIWVPLLAGFSAVLELQHSTTELSLPGVLALESSIDLGESPWGAPLLLSTLLSPAPRFWRRAALEKVAPVQSLSLLQQLPHVATTLAMYASPPVQEEASSEDESGKPRMIFRKDYRPSDFLIDSIELTLKLHEDETEVLSTLRMRRRVLAASQDLVLDGEDLQLERLLLNGKELAEDPQTGYSIMDDGKLRISKLALPEQRIKPSEVPFEVQATVIIRPKANLQLMGLYLSEGTLITQCESTGFRRITYSLDRPDVLTRYRVRLEADMERFPVLLSNGNKVEEGLIDGCPTCHYAVFDDPFPKPSYLFAVVAGRFGVLKDTFTTMSGREVSLQFFSSPESVGKLDLARNILKKSMRWDENNFGREYDLDNLNLVCVNDFNAGAMENKGLLIFNCHGLLADPKTTTDLEYKSMVTVVAHEYFHNWTGNRVTVRDWSELFLKEGLTTFRETLFSATMGSAAVSRIEDVKRMVGHQFKEDSGPLAHPVRPESYASVDNLYTLTVYLKGAEIFRMYQTILGVQGFRKGMDLYFKRHDGKAVTSEHFRRAMQDANDKDLSGFDLWFSQAGTPHVTVEETKYDSKNLVFSLTLRQHTPPTPGQPTKQPLMIPIKIGLIGKESKRDILNPPTQVVIMNSAEVWIRFSDVKEDCVLSVLRDFSAPVKLSFEQSDEELAFLMGYDTDPVNRWRASQKLASFIILSRASLTAQNPSVEFDPLPSMFVDAMRATLLDEKLDNSVKALTLRLPEMAELEQNFRPSDPTALHRARLSVIVDLASALKNEMDELYKKLTVHELERFDQQGTSRRRLRNEILMYLSEFRDREAAERAYEHFSSARCMTDKFYALMSLTKINEPEREVALERFYAEADGNAQMIDIWFRVNASADLPDQVERVALLQDHPAFSFANPNRLRSLLFIFKMWNSVHFHRRDGKGYKLIADAVLKVDKFNRLMAGSLAKLLGDWRGMVKDRQILMKQELERILKEPTLSTNVKEIVSKALNEN